MVETLKSAVKMVGWYIGESWQPALLLLALLYILLSKEEKDKRRLFAAYTGIFAALYFCPVTAKIIMDYCIGELVYWRMFWLLPIPMILAYVATRIWNRQKSRALRVGTLAVLAALVVLSGRCVYGSDGPFQKAGNILKLPPEVCWACDMMRENAPEDGEIRVTAPEELVSFIRQYAPDIKLAYGRRGNTSRKKKRLAEEMLKESPDFRKIARISRKLDCNFLIYPADEWQDENIQALDYERVGNVNTYIVYRDVR